MSAGQGDRSQIFKTVDGGTSWELQFVNRAQGGFFDCMDFWTPESGLAFSDSIGDSLYIIITHDGGQTWRRIPHELLPSANPQEGSFAASGRCLVTTGDSTAFVGTGASLSARVLKTADRGQSWSVFETPITSGTRTSGIMSLSFVDERTGLAAGGELAGPDAPNDNLAFTFDGGRTWERATPPQLPVIFGCTHVLSTGGNGIVAVGPKGIDVSRDGGTTWSSLSKLDHWGVAFGSPNTGWAVGPLGRITRITWD
jgi:photosystem II stability/assembly factor-like uncharacterized protein